MLLTLLYAVSYIATMAILYKKAGKSPWTAVAPVYHSVVMADIAKKPMWAGIVAGITTDLWYVFNWLNLAEGSGLRSLNAIVGFIFSLWLLHHFIKKFDRGIGFWLLWLFLPFIAVFLAKKATYKDTPTDTPAAPQQPYAPAAAPASQPIPTSTPQQFQPAAPQTQPIQPAAAPFQPQAPVAPAPALQPQPAPVQVPAPAPAQTTPPTQQPPMGPTV